MRGLTLVALEQFEAAMPFLERTPVAATKVLYWSPLFDPFRDEPRFAELLATLGCAGEYRVARATLGRMISEPEAEGAGNAPHSGGRL